jgi:hypothetical protein
VLMLQQVRVQLLGGGVNHMRARVAQTDTGGQRAW